MALASDWEIFQGEEGRQLSAFLAARDDPQALATYLAFLDAKDPARAAVLRAEARARLAAIAAEAERENARLAELAGQLRGPWAGCPRSGRPVVK